jgi:hypothetical protein
MDKHLISKLDDIFEALRDDPAFTEAVHRDERGVYLVGGDGSRRYITQIEMEERPLPEVNKREEK